MFTLCIEPTNRCNRNCLHCIRDKLEPNESLDLELAESILKQARALKISTVSLTGGEVTLYPHLEELISMIAEYGFRFKLVTNGFRFQERLLPLLTQPKVKKGLDEVCFSLDGARAVSHDALRGQGSFKEVMEAVTLCRLKELPMTLKSVISNLNKGELTDLALLGATLGAQSHGFISLLPTPRLIRENLIPSLEEVTRLISWVAGSLAQTIRTKILIGGYSPPTVVFWCNAFHTPNVDHKGNLTFCCCLSHVTNEEKPSALGPEFLADLKEVPLSEGIARHFEVLAGLMRQRLKDAENLSLLTYIPCYWCLKYFGKSNWLKNYPESPWAAGVLDDKNEK